MLEGSCGYELSSALELSGDCKFAHIDDTDDIGLQTALLLISVTSNPRIWTMWGSCCKVQSAAVILGLIGRLSLPRSRPARRFVKNHDTNDAHD